MWLFKLEEDATYEADEHLDEPENGEIRATRYMGPSPRYDPTAKSGTAHGPDGESRIPEENLDAYKCKTGHGKVYVLAEDVESIVWV